MDWPVLDENHLISPLNWIGFLTLSQFLNLLLIEALILSIKFFSVGVTFYLKFIFIMFLYCKEYLCLVWVGLSNYHLDIFNNIQKRV